MLTAVLSVLTRAALLALVCMPLSGCFTALSRWGGHRATPSLTVGAAAADIVTAPIQIPALAIAAIDHASSRPTEEQRVRQAAAHAADEAERARILSLARSLQAKLEADNSLLSDDAFWTSLQSEPVASSYALTWYLQTAPPSSPEANAYLLHRFPDHANAILSGGRASHQELTALVVDHAQAHRIREAAIDALVRDQTFAFGEPWRTTLREEFPHKIGLLFGSRRYTREELIQISQDPAQSPDMRRLAALNLNLGHHQKD